MIPAWLTQVAKAYPDATIGPSNLDAVVRFRVGDLDVVVMPHVARFQVTGPHLSSPETICAQAQLGPMLVRVIGEILEANRCTP